MGFDRLASVLLRGGSRLDSVVGPDADLWGVLDDVAQYDPWGSVESPLTARQWRRYVRSLAALWPDLPPSRLADVLCSVLRPTFYTRSDIQVVLSGRRLSDASHPTGEPDVSLLQAAGMLLSSGKSRRHVVRATGLGEHTVDALDEFLGLSDAWRFRMLDRAMHAVEDGWSVRRFAAEAGLSHGMAQRLVEQAKRVRREVDA